MEGKHSGPSCSGLNLVAHPRAKSKVWKYFGFDTDADGCILHWKRIYCRVCMSQIAYSGNTSNLSYHLEKNHPVEFSEFVKSNTDQMREAFATAFSRIKTEPTGLHVQQQSQDTNIRQSLGYENRRHNDLTAAVINFICEGLYPVSVVEEPTFKTLMSTVDPGYSPPSKTDLVVKMLPQMYPTISMVRPVLHMLLNTTLKVKEGDLKEISMTKEVISKVLSSTYSQNSQLSQEISTFLNIATFLDPRYKKLPFLSTQERTKVENNIIEEAKAVLEKQIAERPCLDDFSLVSDEPPSKKQTPLRESSTSSVTQDNPLAAIFCQSDADQSQEELHAQVVEELSNYKSQRVLGLNEDPLLWWTSHAPLFPTLPKVLQKYWCVPATSVPCHRLFSSSGTVLCGKRNRIAPALVDQQVFLYENSRGYYEPEPSEDDLDNVWEGHCGLGQPLE
ncbi:Zinc finger BED domain-containing protein 1 [Nibea albiflora]|uniref:Zinc finger BED domain-containing protein 1 n=1 Tax=Nibea albiflora TaxID=240163 RepID=A0ACB7ER54_NIBAL|nr:Zinc finger BED domain-containing protein 1 [Nibea albiflora]